MFKGISQRLMYTFLGIALVAGLGTAYAAITDYKADVGGAFTLDKWNGLVNEVAAMMSEVNDNAAGTGDSTRIDQLWVEVLDNSGVGITMGDSTRIDKLDVNVAKLMEPAVYDPDKAISCMVHQNDGINSTGPHHWGESDAGFADGGCKNLQDVAPAVTVPDFTVCDPNHCEAGYTCEVGALGGDEICGVKMLCPTGYVAIGGGAVGGKDILLVSRPNKYIGWTMWKMGSRLVGGGKVGFTTVSLTCQKI